jgi:hypothetical protein
MSQPASLPKRITPLLLSLAVGSALLLATPGRATQTCKPDGASCKTNQRCCSGVCTAGVCGSPSTTSSTTTSSTTTTSMASTTTTTLACQAFPATGQITGYGPGTDGDLRKGAPLSYTDNGDGTITDNNTLLVWEKQSQDGTTHDVTNTYVWNDAFGHVATLNTMNFAGHNDWRVPNVKELGSIVNYELPFAPQVSPEFNTSCTYCGTSGCDPTCTVVSTCSCTAAISTGTGYYWSSTTYNQYGLDAWFWNFYDGHLYSIAKTNAFHVRAVRGGL